MRPFQFTEDKVREAEYFLKKLSEFQLHEHEAQYYFSAFLSASRSITFCLQASLSGVPSFETWYERARERLRVDPIAKYFVEARNEAQKVGFTRLNRTSDISTLLRLRIVDGNSSHILEIPKGPGISSDLIVDALQFSESYFVSLLQLVYDCYLEFKMTVDPSWYYTPENFHNRGLTISDAIKEQGYPEAYCEIVSQNEDFWSVLRRNQPLCPINDLFLTYLKKEIEGPRI